MATPEPTRYISVLRSVAIPPPTVPKSMATPSRDGPRGGVSGWTGYIFTGNLELAKKIVLRASRRTEFQNAKIDCRLLKYEMHAGTLLTDK